ncbi:DUF2264 domain-containing protein [Galbibacter sp. EGI 63066]|uniref:DUF2264 domain-containing protein n=1 Tax=Galbibacter sp. EGI 63066 TaxID=2993559 RepID=UPI00224978B9|nr:DUF2264 domain-containing protein [Galbibacter sp. EGI 63066]MCX2678484.1 DUF2264 domain-containing protein [Galbibacter sp. EGI 63066]
MNINKKVSVSIFFLVTSLGIANPFQNKEPSPTDDRDYFVQTLVKIVDPVLNALSKNELKKQMPVEMAPHPYGDRGKYSHLEAFGRTLSGIAPWLELGPNNSEEGKLREKYIELTLKCIANATNPKSPDYMNFSEGGQALVDAAFLAQGLLRAPTQLWEKLDKKTQLNVLNALKQTRGLSPVYSNWLLFTATVEAAILKFEGKAKADMVRIEYALNKHNEWYLGDGVYGDGPEFHWDYYNSYVIQPMMLDIIRVLIEKQEQFKHWRYNYFIKDYSKTLEKAQRYASFQEQLIAPDGTYPPIGRSITYRFGAFQLLSQIALFEKLPENLAPGQVRSALKAVIQKHMSATDMFDKNGWLTLGFYGHQPEMAEGYISTGSLYLCTEVFLVLGLSPENPFWTQPSQDWSQKRIWSSKEK